MNGKEKKNRKYLLLYKEDKELMFFAAIHQNNQFCIITKEATPKVKDINIAFLICIYKSNF